LQRDDKAFGGELKAESAFPPEMLLPGTVAHERQDRKATATWTVGKRG
jgi:hypothetical protein